MATFVLIHGGGHGGWCWDRLSPFLQAEWHKVFAPTLSGVGEKQHLVNDQIDLESHITEIATFLAAEDLTDVILAGHSYGGMVITGVADRLPKRIATLVYLDAVIPLHGESVLDASPGLRALGQSGVRVIDGVELGLWPDTFPLEVFGLVEPEDIAFVVERLTPHPWKTFTQPLVLGHSAALEQIPRAIINCSSTLATRPLETRGRWALGERVFEIDTGHDLMITEPAQVAQMLLELVGSDGAPVLTTPTANLKKQRPPRPGLAPD